MQYVGEFLFHFLDIRGKAGALRHNGDAHVLGAQSLFGKHSDDLGEQLHAVRARKTRVRIGKVKADVPHPRRREQGVHQGMDGGVPVRVRLQGARGGDFHPAQHDGVAVLRKGVRICPEAHPFGGGKVLGIGEFSVGAFPQKEAGRLGIGGVDAALVAENAPVRAGAFVGAEQSAAVKSLRRLHGGKSLTRGNVHDVPVQHLCHRIREGERTYAAAKSFHALDAVADELIRHEGARCVMHEHDLSLCRAQGGIDALAARTAARDGARIRIGGEQRTDGLQLPGRAGDEHLICERGEHRERIAQHGQTVIAVQHLVARKPRARAASRRAHDRTDHVITS